jgi:MFS family permease
LVFPSTLALINVLFSEGAERNRALGLWAGAGAAGLVIGVVMGGALTSYFGWRAVFLVNVPLAGLALVVAPALIDRDPPIARNRAFDLPGAVSITGAVSLIVLVLVEGTVFGWRSPATIGILLIGLFLAAAFIVIERRSAAPLLPLAMLRNPWLMLGLITAFLFMATFGALLYFLSIFFQNVLGYDALATGFAFLVPTLIVVLSSTLAGRLVTRFGLNATMKCALAIGVIGALAIGFNLSPDVVFPSLVPGLILVSVGDGVIFTTMFIAAATGVPNDEQGVASGIVSTAAGVGAALGLAVLVLIANTGTGGLAGDALRTATAVGISRAAYAIAGGVALMLVILIVFARVLCQEGGGREFLR